MWYEPCLKNTKTRGNSKDKGKANLHGDPSVYVPRRAPGSTATALGNSANICGQTAALLLPSEGRWCGEAPLCRATTAGTTSRQPAAAFKLPPNEALSSPPAGHVPASHRQFLGVLFTPCFALNYFLAKASCAVKIKGSKRNLALK